MANVDEIEPSGPCGRDGFTMVAIGAPRGSYVARGPF